jgi:hypothetical protein
VDWNVRAIGNVDHFKGFIVSERSSGRWLVSGDIDEALELARCDRWEKQRGHFTLKLSRMSPGSPLLNKAALHDALIAAGIRYEHLVELGGRRPVRADSHNLAWRNASFRGYADYMETQPFLDGIDHLLDIARTGRTAVMCSEAVWWRCHRSMIADYLKARGVQVLHILSLKVI